MDVKKAIQTGDAAGLRRLLIEDPARANELIHWGKVCEIHTHPLHFISDMLFDGTLPRGKEIALVEALLEAGADCNHRARNGETPLIGAASLGAEEVGLRLLEAGAAPNALGGFKETALHWAALLGLHRLTGRLIEKGSRVDLRDGRYNATPLGWAIHGRLNPPAGNQGHHPQVVAQLVAAGARPDPEFFSDQNLSSDAEMLAALEQKRA